MHRWTVGVLLISLLVLAVAGVAYAPYHTQTQPSPEGGAARFKSQAQTASAHASFAADSSSMRGAKEHLGHAIACIEGPKGKNVNSAWENPCAGQGNGVLGDLKASKVGAAWVPVAEAADSLALVGLKASDLAQAKNTARGVSELMGLIAEAK